MDTTSTTTQATGLRALVSLLRHPAMPAPDGAVSVTVYMDSPEKVERAATLLNVEATTTTSGPGHIHTSIRHAPIAGLDLTIVHVQLVPARVTRDDIAVEVTP